MVFGAHMVNGCFSPPENQLQLSNQVSSLWIPENIVLLCVTFWNQIDPTFDDPDPQICYNEFRALVMVDSRTLVGLQPSSRAYLVRREFYLCNFSFKFLVVDTLVRCCTGVTVSLFRCPFHNADHSTFTSPSQGDGTPCNGHIHRRSPVWNK
ncbi:hypothetical protein BDZ97DRAFT_1399663 [Flammula alnicola]|nr:hypothetical protein BDZ97DRAFT_1399663 [Flammula alnicola]